tara:strand:- start:490 stop:723 length:234 start_codon:yes stop_codon:yes gene_type:complete
MIYLGLFSAQSLCSLHLGIGAILNTFYTGITPDMAQDIFEAIPMHAEHLKCDGDLLPDSSEIGLPFVISEELRKKAP